MSKTALIGLTKVLSQSLIEDNIRVNCIAPGVVKTKSSRVVSRLDLIINKKKKIVDPNTMPDHCRKQKHFRRNSNEKSGCT